MRETSLLELLRKKSIVKHISDKGESELKNAKLEDVMEPVPPIVDYDTPANSLVPLIRFSKCILVSKKIKNNWNNYSN